MGGGCGAEKRERRIAMSQTIISDRSFVTILVLCLLLTSLHSTQNDALSKISELSAFCFCVSHSDSMLQTVSPRVFSSVIDEVDH